MNEKDNVVVQWAAGETFVPAERDLIKWANKSRQSIDKKEITIRITNENESQNLNMQFRTKAAPTNVLSFPAAPLAAGVLDAIQENQLERLALGDIVLCAPLINREAREQGKTMQAHWAHIVIHGVLHLQGYDHLTEADARKMEALEIRLLAELGFSNPYLERNTAQ